jgi:hypothetical protein
MNTQDDIELLYFNFLFSASNLACATFNSDVQLWQKFGAVMRSN